MTQKRLTRSKTERIIAGVCGGIAKRYDWDPAWTRIFIILLWLLTGLVPLLIVYLFMWVIVPEG